jgi:hypothetical protein
MAMYFLMYRVKPTAANNAGPEIKGAYANCLILSTSIDRAEEIARFKINELDWQIIDLEEGYEVINADYIDNANGMEMYEQALIDKEVYTFHTYTFQS